jgi:hypothetical protein
MYLPLEGVKVAVFSILVLCQNGKKGDGIFLD